MSHDEDHRASTGDKIVRMANQIGTFFKSKPHDEGVEGVAEHINKFWDPRMRRLFFDLTERGDAGFLPIVLDAAGLIRRPNDPVSAVEATQADAGAPGGKGSAAGESQAEIASSQR